MKKKKKSGKIKELKRRTEMMKINEIVWSLGRWQVEREREIVRKINNNNNKNKRK